MEKLNDLSRSILVRNAQRGIDELISNGESVEMLRDGYHTFGELYEHRIVLWIKLCEMLYDIDNYKGNGQNVWKSKVHSDGSCDDGWFLLGYNETSGQQITYHLPISKWDACYFAKELGEAPEFDGHTSADVLKRLSEI